MEKGRLRVETSAAQPSHPSAHSGHNNGQNHNNHNNNTNSSHSGHNNNNSGHQTSAGVSAGTVRRPLNPSQPHRTTKTSQKLVVFPDHPTDAPYVVTDVASEFDDSDSTRSPPHFPPSTSTTNAFQQPPLVQYPYDVAKEKEAERMRRLDKRSLARVTAYCSATSYNMDALIKYLRAPVTKASSHTDPIRIDECVYTPFMPPPTIFQLSSSRGQTPNTDLEKHDDDNPITSPKETDSLLSKKVHSTTSTPTKNNATPRKRSNSITSLLSSNTSPVKQQVMQPQKPGELFFFEYGVVVMWGLTEAQELYVLSLLTPFEQEKLDPDEIETEQFHFQYRALSQPRIFNDIITLRLPNEVHSMNHLRSALDTITEATAQQHQAAVDHHPLEFIPKSQSSPDHHDRDASLPGSSASNDYMIKLTISHAIAQSVKLTLFEGWIENTINSTKHIPNVMAQTGKVQMSRVNITKKIGQLFVMRIQVNLVSPILDKPEIFWSEPSLDPLYSAVRGYLEISQRVELLNQRCSVISDLLDMLKDHLTSAHGETLEWIVIILIAIEILLGLVTIVLELMGTFGGNHDG